MAHNLKLLLLLLFKVPLMVQVAILHVLKLAEPAKYLDLRSHLVISVLRSILHPSKPLPVSYLQHLTTRRPEVKGKMWISHYTSPAPPDTGVRDTLMEALESMRDPATADTKARIPELAPVEAEWTGYRAAASPEEPLPDISERAKYHEMMKECREPTTVLYLHGGAFYLCDPATHRTPVSKLAEMTGGTCYSVRYRLAPQHPFPSALLDAFASYLTLLYPPPDAYHEAVKPEQIVFAGDSAGGNLALALLQLVLQLCRLDARVQWYGEARQVPLPAAVACVSPWLDITQSSPAWQGEEPHAFDYLPKPRLSHEAKIPPCNVWPASPPRRFMYADDDLVAHPLSSVIMSRSWEGSPPIWMCTGWELLAYEHKALAAKLAAEGVPLVFEEYEAMPHCFALFLTRLGSAQRCLESWAGFIRRAVGEPAAITPSATAIKSLTLEEAPLCCGRLLEDSLEHVQARVALKAAIGSQDRQPEARAKL